MKNVLLRSLARTDLLQEWRILPPGIPGYLLPRVEVQQKAARWDPPYLPTCPARISVHLNKTYQYIR